MKTTHSYEVELLCELTAPLRWRDAEITRLRAKVEELEQKNSELLDLAMRQVATSDAMKLELILSGALQLPQGKVDS